MRQPSEFGNNETWGLPPRSDWGNKFYCMLRERRSLPSKGHQPRSSPKMTFIKSCPWCLPIINLVRLGWDMEHQFTPWNWADAKRSNWTATSPSHGTPVSPRFVLYNFPGAFSSWKYISKIDFQNIKSAAERYSFTFSRFWTGTQEHCIDRKEERIARKVQ